MLLTKFHGAIIAFSPFTLGGHLYRGQELDARRRWGIIIRRVLGACCWS
jgi:hypothetical protein